MRASRLLALLAGISCSVPVLGQTQADLDALARTMGVRLTIVDNRPASCPKQASGCFLSHLDLTIPATIPTDFAAGKFQLYFNSVSPVIKGVSDTFQVRHLNGDLHVIEPKAGVRVAAGSAHRLQLWTGGHFFSAYYPMPNMFLVSGALKARVIDATRPRIDPASGLEQLPFVAPMTDEQRLGTAGPGDDTRWLTAERAFDLYADRGVATQTDMAIIPTPTSVSRPGGRSIDLRNGATLRLSGLKRSDVAAALDRLSASAVPSFDRGPELRIRAGVANFKDDAYRLRAAEGVIVIEAATAAGAANALQSLAQQVAFDKGVLRPLSIEDAPRLPFRGLHLDLARNFHSKGQVLKLIDQMAVYKLNKLHLHLGDDEGWRLQIRRFPELTEVGGFRCFDPGEDNCLLPQLGSGPDRDTPVNGFLSQADYRDILSAAKARHIEVIPSFDMPGHSRAAIKSMEVRYRRLIRAGQRDEAERFRLVDPEDRTRYSSVQHYTDNTLNVCLESTYRFLDAVIDEVAAMHAAAGTPLKTYHIGADETAGAWIESPACKTIMTETGRTAPQLGAMFIERVSASPARRGIAVGGWSDGMGHADPTAMPARVQSNIWSDLFTAAPAETVEHATRGWDAVISVPTVLYFDVPYAPHPLERGYDWPTRGTDTFKVFSFMPENLAANALVMKNSRNQPVTVTAPAVVPRTAGMQAQLWSETVRSDALVDHMLFPRLLAFAERAWHRAAWEVEAKPGTSYTYSSGQVLASLQRDWGAFAAKWPFHSKQLSDSGVTFRLAPPGARITRGMLEANAEFRGSAIEFRVPGGQWQTYKGLTAVSSTVELRTRTIAGDRTSRIVKATYH